jgi:hypothetical protein
MQLTLPEGLIACVPQQCYKDLTAREQEAAGVDFSIRQVTFIEHIGLLS